MVRARLCQRSTPANVRALGVESKLTWAPMRRASTACQNTGKAAGVSGYASEVATNVPGPGPQPKHCAVWAYIDRGESPDLSDVADCAIVSYFATGPGVPHVTLSSSMA